MKETVVITLEQITASFDSGSVDVYCPHCEEYHRLEPDYEGDITCNNCGEIFIVINEFY